MKKTIIIILFLLASVVHADCGGIWEYKVKTKVLQCSSPELDDISAKLKFHKIASDYKGVELNTSHGKIFIQESTGLSCQNIKLNKFFTISIKLSCCDGDPNVPCLLGYDKKAVNIEPQT